MLLIRLIGAFLAVTLLPVARSALSSDFASKLSILSFDALSLPTALAHLRQTAKERNTSSSADFQQELEIAESFVKQLFKDLSRSTEGRLRTSSLIDQLKERFGQYRRKWLKDMHLKLMDELGLDLNDRDLVEQALLNPDKFDLNYETYKVLLKPDADE